MNNNSGIGVLGALGVVFVTLKLMDIIDWSWWYVTLPFWGGLALVVLILIMFLFVKLIELAINKYKSTNSGK